MFMRAALIGACLTLASAQSSVLSFTAVPNPVTDGQPQAITYQTNDTVSPVTITLRQGLSTDLKTLYNLTTTALGGSYIWTPRKDLPNGNDYALEITQGDQINYYGPFRVQGYSGESASASGSASGSSSGLPSSITVAPSASASGFYGTASTGFPRNTTFSGATLSSTATTTASMTALVPQNTGAAATIEQMGGSVLLIGAMAAALVV